MLSELTNNAVAFCNRQSQVRVQIIGFTLAAAIFVIDLVTGIEFSFSLFYLLPIFFIAWFNGRTAGIGMSLVCAVLWVLADLLASRPFSHPLFPTWNAVVMSSFFVLFTYLLTAFKEIAQREKELARETQLGFLPKSIPQLQGCEIATAWQPADGVAGDYYDILKFDHDALGLCIADVVGHGMPAALLMSNLQAGVTLLATRELSPQDLCHRLNKLVYQNVKRGDFITLLYGLLETKAHRFTYTSAGHNPAILLRANGQTTMLSKGALPLGVRADQQYLQEVVQLQIGDRLVLYTDGLTECRNDQDQDFGEDRLLSLLSKHCQLSAVELQQFIMSSADQFCRGKYLDDIALVVVAVQ